jgi:hypothetical protein
VCNRVCAGTVDRTRAAQCVYQCINCETRYGWFSLLFLCVFNQVFWTVFTNAENTLTQEVSSNNC